MTARQPAAERPVVVPLWAAPLLAPITTVSEPVTVSEPDEGLVRVDLADGETAYIRRTDT